MDATKVDQLLVLLNQECTAYRTSDYLATGRTTFFFDETSDPNTKKRKLGSSSPKDEEFYTDIHSKRTKNNDEHCRRTNSVMNEEWRFKMVEWTYRVVDHFDLDREIVFVATNYMDRCLATQVHKVVDKENLQLLTMTCLYLAIKLYEREAVTLQGTSSTMESLLYLARSKFNLEQMKAMEYEVLHRLQWRCHPPTPQNFIELCSPILSTHYPCKLREHARYLVELSAMDYFFVSYKPSEIAIASLLCSVETVADEKPGLLDTLLSSHHLWSFEDDRILDCKDRLRKLLDESGEDFEFDITQAAKECRISSPVSVTNTSTFVTST